MPSWKHLVIEIHRRSLWQVLGIYLAAAWGVLQFVEFLTRVAGLPEWVPPAALVLCAVGLPIVLATAFIQEGHPLRDRHSEDPTLLPGLVDAAGQAVTVKAVAKPPVRRWLSWKRALAGGLVAFTGLGATAGGYLGLRALGIGPAGTLLAAGVLTAADGVVLADFEARGVDPSMAGVITEALRIDLSRSRAFVLVDPADMQQVLSRMAREPGASLTAEAARDAAQREGYGLVLAGEAGRLGSGYVLAARLLVPETGVTVAAFRHTARSENELLAAVDALSRAVRTKIGESLRTVRASEPLERVTTSSMEALLRYTTAERIVSGREEPDGRSAFALMEEAVELDSTFAMAHRKLGAWYMNSRMRTEAVRSMEAAYRHRERLPEMERRMVDALYSTYVLLDEFRARESYLRALELDPDDKSALNNLGAVHVRLGSYEAAIETGLRGMAQPYAYTTQHYNTVPAYIALKRWDEAEALADTLVALEPQGRYGWLRRTEIAWNRGQVQRADSVASTLVGWDSTPSQRWYDARLLRFSVRAAQGRLAAATADLDGIEEIGAVIPRRLTFLVSTPRLMQVRVLAEVRGDAAAAGTLLDRLLRDYPLDSLPELDVPLADLAHAAISLGRLGDAERWLALSDARRSPDAIRKELPHQLAQARLLAASGRERESIDLLRMTALQNFCTQCVAYPLAQAFDRLGAADSAAVHYRHYIETPASARVIDDAWYLAAAHFRLAELLEARGDAAGAVRHYGEFVNLWRNADAALQPRVRTAQQRLAALRGPG
jgi:eukaryotic-like serine/threonine-protein kinase